MDEVKDNKVISKKNSGFPEYLDFNLLRKEGIEYLGKLSGKLWTDHNVHDPGITILEVLCYALLDLGYRTNLPAIDVFTKNPEDHSTDNNFYTPLQILSCNPVTITDYRKLIIDIAGVKNAWLEVAEDQTDFCRRRPDSDPVSSVPTHDSTGYNRPEQCVDFLNGLYHVYIDLEKNLEKDFKDIHERNEYAAGIVKKVKKTVMAHRNICEDFVDITILCREEIGVCAELELDGKANAEEIYLEVVERLRSFFSPSPKFYTLPQLLEKNKNIQEIFEGRPFDLRESHGFLDTEEFELLQLKKEIHLSDLYQELLSIGGIKAVRRLKLVKCNQPNFNGSTEWKYQIPANHVPDFSLECSAFRFVRNSMPLPVDFKKYEGFFEINFQHNGKILYQSPSPYLDLEIPKGIYRPDLSDYYSIQNEFPKVYGISEGGLAKDAPKVRVAQALQLKGYLLFFDQLLANYLTQLKNIRSLFAMYPSGDEAEDHTYFINDLTTVPDLESLLRFGSGNKLSGQEGSTILFPVDRRNLEASIASKAIESIEIHMVPAYLFGNTTERDIVIQQIIDNLYHEFYSIEVVEQSNECAFYYLTVASEDFALISTKYYKSREEALQASETVKYLGTFEENYTKINNPSAGSFSFTLDFNLTSYTKYLKLIIEDKELFLKRRDGFLDHLLARFSERFTDFAMLSYDFVTDEALPMASIKAKEKFLKHYPELSSTRGKGYDYLSDGWSNTNTSGLEKRFKALTGIKEWKKRSLCNFEVFKYEDTYNLFVAMEGITLFQSDKPFEFNNAVNTLEILFKTAATTGEYSVYFDDHLKKYAFQLKLENGQVFSSPLTYQSKEEAETGITFLKKTFSSSPSQDDIFVSKFLYRAEFRDFNNNVIRRYKKSYTNPNDILNSSEKLVSNINEAKYWQVKELDRPIVNLYENPLKDAREAFIELDKFKIDIDDNIEGKPDKFTFELLDRNNKFKFLSSKEFGSKEEAENASKLLIALLMKAENYQIFLDEESGKFSIQIFHGGDVQAVTSSVYGAEEQALKKKDAILGLVRQHQYFLTVEERPHRWKYQYALGFKKEETFVFQSGGDFDSQKDAFLNAEKFHRGLSRLNFKEKNKRLLLESDDDEQLSVSINPKLSKKLLSEKENTRKSLSKLVALERQIHEISESPDPSALRQFIRLDENSRKGNFVYRLVDKDDRIAYSPLQNKIQSEAEGRSIIDCLFNLAYKGYPFLEICLGGDIVLKTQDPGANTVVYRYLIKCRNRFNNAPTLSGKELVLFVSTSSFASSDDAEKAFKENYLLILKKALNPRNYGDNNYIDFKESNNNNSSNNEKGVVFIPEETIKYLGGTDAVSIEKLIELVKSYPIRYIRPGVYKFVLYNPQTHRADWRSYGEYSTPQNAMQAFYFFCMLLRYKGNYYLLYDQDLCAYQLYIREVLAESRERFVEARDAWGKEGIQKFISISQTEDAFHTFLRKNDCCYTFNVSCKNPFLIHPCRYNSADKRDRVIEIIFSIFNKLGGAKYLLSFLPTEEEVLNDLQGMPLARFFKDDSQQRSVCSQWVEFMENISIDRYYHADPENKIYLSNSLNRKIAEPVARDIDPKLWKQKLQEVAYYFPIVKKPEKDKDKYCIEIRLPGFNDLAEDMKLSLPCSNNGADKPDDCYVVWKSDCCFSSCEEMIRNIRTLAVLLSDYKNYRAIFDCTCGNYGIEIQKEENIVAFNPQCYPSPQMTCEAVERAKDAINSEGLHLVEHILLRPHCPEDCNCRGRICETIFDRCHLPSWPRTGDICDPRGDICFQPGADPYSFIATVALPAWPERFRKDDNKKLIENILQREVPAHILLRFLWLAPHDFCCFETYYKKWNRWLADKKFCNERFSNCDFVQFLFERNFECLDNTPYCQDCDEDPSVEIPCLEDGRPPSSIIIPDFMEQMNTLFCWKQKNCDEYQFRECGEVNRDPQPQPGIIAASNKSVTEKEAFAKKPTSVSKEKSRMLANRRSIYIKNINAIYVKSDENSLAKMGLTFISDNKPSIEKLSGFIDEVLENKNPKNKEFKALTKAQRTELIANLVSNYVEKIVLTSRSFPEEDALTSLVEKLKSKKVNFRRIVELLDITQLKKYAVEKRIAKVEEILTTKP